MLGRNPPADWWNVVLVTSLILVPTFGLDNGLARTPPMGWLSWARFGCSTACADDPDNCIGERLMMRIADALVAGGFRDAGYEYVCIDDCWPAEERDERGRLQANTVRFPHGIKALADYVHSKGLKFGLYEDVGRHTCAGAPGSEDHLEIDAQTFAEWGVDMLKFDGCNAEGSYRDYGYPQMAKYLNATGRPILYYCEWPIYPWEGAMKPNFTLVADACNMFRIYGDTYDNYHSVYSILQHYGDNTGNFTDVAGPGNWNDADMITIGNFGQSVDQSRLQMGMWAIIATPIFMSVDVATMPRYARDLYMNKRVIAISQDKLGIQGTRRMRWGTKDNLQVWMRPVSPPGSYAIAFLNYYEHGYPLRMSVNLTHLGLDHVGGYNVTEVFDDVYMGMRKPSQNLTCFVNPTGIYLIKATIVGHLNNAAGKAEQDGFKINTIDKF